jgi:hypothetical protein
MYCFHEIHSLEAFQENLYQFEGAHFELVIDVFCLPNLLLMRTR